MTQRLAALFGVALATAIALSVLPATPVQAADVSFTLFGNATEGWGSTNTSLSTPGPTLTVDEGDNVTLILNATDTANHNWFIDYDNDTNDDAAEPNSPNFQDSEITWNFTADRNGTFVYRCRFHPDMWGTIVVRPAGSTPSTPLDSGATAALIAVAVVVIIVVALAFVAMFRKKKTPPPPQE